MLGNSVLRKGSKGSEGSNGDQVSFVGNSPGMTNVTRILVIDDDESIRNSFSTALRDVGFHVDTAENGTEAIKKSEAGFYNLALVDIRLPDMEGTELLTKLKETTPKMVKVIVTGFPSLQNAVDAVNRGADAYIIKPARMEALLKLIGEHLAKQRAAEAFGEKKVLEFVETRVRKMEDQE
jgi:DNA-binding NtrC family response regulator